MGRQCMSFDVGVFSGVTGSLVAIGGLVITLWKTRGDRKQGVAQVEVESRRDTIADRDALIDQHQEDIRELRTRVTLVEIELDIEQQWTQALRDHIYRQLPPPPPGRPSRPKS